MNKKLVFYLNKLHSMKSKNKELNEVESVEDKVGNKDFCSFIEVVGEMINILGLDFYNIICKNSGFVKNDDDEIDINIPSTEKQLTKSFLILYNSIYKVCRNVELQEKIEISKVIDDVISFPDANEIPDWVVSGNWELMFYAISPSYNNYLVYDEFDNGRIKNGLVRSANSIFSLFIKGSNSTADREIKDSISCFLDTYGHGLYLKEEYKDSVIIHDKSIELSPDCNVVAEHYTNRGKALLKLGNVKGAKKDFEKALEKDEKFEEAKKLIAEIKTLPQSRLMTGKGIDNSNMFDL